MEYKDYYKLMGVARNASADDIRRAWRKLARRFHPDVSKESGAEAKFKEVQEAYEVLKDPEKRAAYDQLGANYKSGQQFRPPPGWGQKHEYSFSTGEDAGFSDFFSSLFGARGSFEQRPGGRFDAGGSDQHARIEIALEEAYRGGAQTIRLQHPVRTADGRVRMETRDLKVTIPAGAVDGQQLRLRGQGDGGTGQGAAGDLYLEIAIRPHPLYQLEGRDVILTLPVAPWEAALGAAVEVPTLDGLVEMKIPAGVRAGQRLRLKGRGLPGKSPGDEYAVIKIVVPPAEKARVRELYEELQRESKVDVRAELKRHASPSGAGTAGSKTRGAEK